MHNFVAIDFETSDYHRDSACSVGLVRVEQGIITEEFSCLIRPPRAIMRFTEIHGITWADVAEQPTFAEHWPRINSFFQNVHYAVAHNASFDRGVLVGCCQAFGIIPPTVEFRCTVQVARNHFKIYPAKLSNVCQVLGLDLNHHEALSDARACANIMLRALLPGTVQAE